MSERQKMKILVPHLISCLFPCLIFFKAYCINILFLKLLQHRDLVNGLTSANCFSDDAQFNLEEISISNCNYNILVCLIPVIKWIVLIHAIESMQSDDANFPAMLIWHFSCQTVTYKFIILLLLVILVIEPNNHMVLKQALYTASM